MLESMFHSMNRSSPVPAVVMQPQTMMLPPLCLTIGKTHLSWYSSPEHGHTWPLRLIRPQEMVPVIHALGQVVFNKLFAGFFVSHLQKRLPSETRPCNPTCCSVWRMVWALKSWSSSSATSKTMLAALMHLFFEASFCTWRTAQGLNFFDRPLRGLLHKCVWSCQADKTWTSWIGHVVLHG